MGSHFTKRLRMRGTVAGVVLLAAAGAVIGVVAGTAGASTGNSITATPQLNIGPTGATQTAGNFKVTLTPANRDVAKLVLTVSSAGGTVVWSAVPTVTATGVTVHSTTITGSDARRLILTITTRLTITTESLAVSAVKYTATGASGAVTVTVTVTTGATFSPASASDAYVGNFMTVSPVSVVASSTGNTLLFTYTAGSGGTITGGIHMTVPTGWSTASATSSAGGYVTTTCGLLAVSSRTITVSGMTKAAGATCSIVYGSQVSSGPGATAPATTGTSTFVTLEKSTLAGAFSALSTGSPSVNVVSANGSGTMKLSSGMANTTDGVAASSTGNTLVFSYTAALGGTTHGKLQVTVPATWTASSSDHCTVAAAYRAVGLW